MKEKLNVSLSTILLILSLFVNLYMGGIIYKFYNEKLLETNSLETIFSEEVKIDSEYGDLISDYLTNVWLGIELYKENMPEFQNIKSAPKDYLAYCSAWKSMNTNSDSKIKINEFNDSLISLFGTEADNLIEKNDIENVFFVSKNSNETYDFSGFGGSETHFNDYVINKIEKDNNIFAVSLYEYKSIVDIMYLDLEDGESTNRCIYDKNDNLILTTTIKAIQDGNIMHFKEYDENGNEIDSLQHLLLSKYEDKLTIRKITLQYNSDNNSFIMLNNKLEK